MRKLPIAPCVHEQVQKNKVWEEVQPGLETNANRVANWNGIVMMTSDGEVRAESIANGNIS